MILSMFLEQYETNADFELSIISKSEASSSLNKLEWGNLSLSVH